MASAARGTQLDRVAGELGLPPCRSSLGEAAVGVTRRMRLIDLVYQKCFSTCSPRMGSAPQHLTCCLRRAPRSSASSSLSTIKRYQALVGLTVAIPYLPFIGVFGFVPLPRTLLVTVIAITALYVVATEMTKPFFTSVEEFIDEVVFQTIVPHSWLSNPCQRFTRPAVPLTVFRPRFTALLARFTVFRAVRVTRAIAFVLLRRARVAVFCVPRATAFAFSSIAVAPAPAFDATADIVSWPAASASRASSMGCGCCACNDSIVPTTLPSAWPTASAARSTALGLRLLLVMNPPSLDEPEYICN